MQYISYVDVIYNSSTLVKDQFISMFVFAPKIISFVNFQVLSSENYGILCFFSCLSRIEREQFAFLNIFMCIFFHQSAWRIHGLWSVFVDDISSSFYFIFVSSFSLFSLYCPTGSNDEFFIIFAFYTTISLHDT